MGNFETNGAPYTGTTQTNRKTMITMYFSQYNHAHTSICSKVFLWLAMHVIKIVSPKNNLLWSKFNLRVGLQQQKLSRFEFIVVALSDKRGSISSEKQRLHKWLSFSNEASEFVQNIRAPKSGFFFQLVTNFFCGCLLRVILCYLYVPVEETRGVVFKIFLFAWAAKL